MAENGTKTRILLVDDEPLLVRAVRRMLERGGYAVVSFQNGPEALCAIESDEEEPFELILCDLRMPGFGGAKVYAELEARHPQLLSRLVFITGDAEYGEHRDFLSAKRCPYLVKPFTTHRLLEVVEATLNTADNP